MSLYTNLYALQADLAAGKISCLQLVEHYLEQTRKHADLNAFLEVFDAAALQKAAEVDEKRAAGTAGRLHGLVIGIKDVICYKDHKLTCGSKILDDFESLFSATCLERLLAEDAIVIGRLNCDEFAMGSTNEHSAFGPVKNGADPTRVPGGSSGGSAVAVQTDQCLLALGSDTGGSVRQPASFCGVIGMKPTYGRISRYGLVAYASSFDQIGMFSHSIEDAALTLEIMSGKDRFDSTCSSKEVPSFSTLLDESGTSDTKSPQKRKIAYPEEALQAEGLDDEIRQAHLDFIEKLKAAGHQVDAVSMPEMDALVPAYYVMTCAEASSNLSRYDGIHYGYRDPEATDLESTYKLSRSNGFGTEVKRRIMLGTFVLSSGYYDAYYNKAQRVRRKVQQATEVLLADYDFILTPTAPTTAFKLGEAKDQDPTTMYLADIFTVQANLCGIPAISLPLFQHSNGMPFGAQLMCAKWAEAELLSFAQSVLKESTI